MSAVDLTVSEATVGAAAGPGHVLAEARISRNLSLAEVAQQLKLSIWQVEALEADAYDRLPGPVFVRGFVRNYARLLELDPHLLNELLVLPDAAHPASAAVPYSRNIPFPVQRPAVWGWPRYVLVLCLLVVAAAAYEFLFPGKRQEAQTTLSPVGVTVPAAVVQPATQQSAGAGIQEKPLADAQPAEAASVVPVPAAEPVPEQPSLPVVPQPATKSLPAPAAQSARAGLADVHFRFETESWVEVRDAGSRLLFSQLNPAGTEHHLQARPPLSLIVGNATGVRLEYNGKPFDLKPHTRVDVARFTLE